MVGFRTFNSTYYVDTANKTITGGFLKDKKYVYTKASIMIGAPAIVNIIKDGEEMILKTDKVLSYI